MQEKTRKDKKKIKNNENKYSGLHIESVALGFGHNGHNKKEKRNGRKVMEAHPNGKT